MAYGELAWPLKSSLLMSTIRSVLWFDGERMEPT
jgi:hypothetical protein